MGPRTARLTLAGASALAGSRVEHLKNGVPSPREQGRSCKIIHTFLSACSLGPIGFMMPDGNIFQPHGVRNANLVPADQTLRPA